MGLVGRLGDELRDGAGGFLPGCRVRRAAGGGRVEVKRLCLARAAHAPPHLGRRVWTAALAARLSAPHFACRLNAGTQGASPAAAARTHAPKPACATVAPRGAEPAEHHATACPLPHLRQRGLEVVEHVLLHHGAPLQEHEHRLLQLLQVCACPGPNAVESACGVGSRSHASAARQRAHLAEHVLLLFHRSGVLHELHQPLHVRLPACVVWAAPGPHPRVGLAPSSVSPSMGGRVRMRVRVLLRRAGGEEGVHAQRLQAVGEGDQGAGARPRGKGQEVKGRRQPLAQPLSHDCASRVQGSERAVCVRGGRHREAIWSARRWRTNLGRHRWGAFPARLLSTLRRRASAAAMPLCAARRWPRSHGPTCQPRRGTSKRRRRAAFRTSRLE